MHTTSDLQCPSCQLPFVVTKNYGRKIGASIGATGGFIKGVAGALKGAQAGARILSFAGPAGITLGTLGGALVGGLVSGTTFGLIGASIGSALDQHVLDNYECEVCGKSFSMPSEYDSLWLNDVSKINSLTKETALEDPSDSGSDPSSNTL